jgi:methylated-DNA-[protein]-cysteine S-methyltransferase
MSMTATTMSKIPTTLFASSLPTPVGPLWFAVDGAGALTATAFGDLPALQRRVLGTAEWVVDRSAEAPGLAARAQLQQYFAGERATFALALAPIGSPFQHSVWRALQRIPVGETRSYGQLAAELGSAARAVGRANACNPIAVVVPCHRVIGADGTLTGFAFGLDTKRWLLAHERGLVRPHAAAAKKETGGQSQG